MEHPRYVPLNGKGFFGGQLSVYYRLKSNQSRTVVEYSTHTYAVILSLQATMGGLWSPNVYKFLNSVNGSNTICSGDSVYATVTAGHMVRKEFAEENPMTVAKILSGWLRAVTFINDEANKEEVLEFISTFYAKYNVEIPRSSMEMDLKLVGLFELDKQLDWMTRVGSPPTSDFDRTTNDVANFLASNGVIVVIIDIIRGLSMRKNNERSPA